MKSSNQENKIVTELAHRLNNFNEWRRGGDMAMPDPHGIGVDIDMAIVLLKKSIENTK